MARSTKQSGASARSELISPNPRIFYPMDNENEDSKKALASQLGYLMNELPTDFERRNYSSAGKIAQALKFLEIPKSESRPIKPDELKQIAIAMGKSQDEFEAAVNYRYPEAYGGIIQDARKVAMVLIKEAEGILAYPYLKTPDGVKITYKEVEKAYDDIARLVNQVRVNAGTIEEVVKSGKLQVFDQDGNESQIKIPKSNDVAKSRANDLADLIDNNGKLFSGAANWNKDDNINDKKETLRKMFGLPKSSYKDNYLGNY